MALLFLQSSMSVKDLLTDFLTDIVINDAYMEQKITCLKQCLNINQRYRPTPFCNFQSSWMSGNDSGHHAFLMTGSFAEGLSVPPIFGVNCKMDISDCDIIRVMPLVTCDFDASSQKATFSISTQYTHSGYCHLTWSLNTTDIDHLETIQSITDQTLQLYPYADNETTYCLPSSPLPSSWISVINHPNAERHGPAQQIKLQFVTSGLDAIYSFDDVIALYCPSWPSLEWIDRQRSPKWPTVSVIHDIVKRGCHLVPVAHATSPKPDIE